MKEMFIKAYKGIVRMEEFLSKLLLGAIVFVTFLAAMSRTFGFPLPWSQDLVLLLFAWFTWMAASQASRRKKHIGVDILTIHFSERTRLILETICHLLTALFLLLILYGAIKFSFHNARRMITTLNLSYFWINITVAVGSFLMIISELIYFVQGILQLTGKWEAG